MKKLFLVCLLLVLGVSAVDRALKLREKDSHFKNHISRIKKQRVKSHSTADDACSSLNYGDWKDLGTFKPSNDLLHGVVGWFTIHYQPVVLGLGDVNLDLYEVEITTFPTDHSTAKDLFEYWRTDLGKGDDTQFVDKNQCSFKAFDDGEATRWTSADPKTTYITIHLARLMSSITSFSFDDGSVICSDYSSGDDEGYWIFSVIHSLRDHDHPVSGNRRFGFYKQDDKTVFYTKGVDRVTTLIDRMASAMGQVFENADLTWISMQDKLVDYVNNNGGAATKRPRTSNRCDWDTVWGSWTETCNHGAVEIPGGCHTTNPVSCDAGTSTCEPNGDTPCADPGVCTCGSLQCFCGRPPADGKVCDPYK